MMYALSFVLCSAMFYAPRATAQGVNKCLSADGKISYSERCDSGSSKQAVAAEAYNDKAGKDRSAQIRKDEADFQKRHAEREKLAMQERNAKRRAAVQGAEIDLKREKLALAKDKEKRLNKDKKKSPKAGKPKTEKAAKATP
jgi:hypothetical protein